MEALSRQWYPIVKAADMKAETPSGVEALSRRLVNWRSVGLIQRRRGHDRAPDRWGTQQCCSPTRQHPCTEVLAHV